MKSIYKKIIRTSLVIIILIGVTFYLLHKQKNKIYEEAGSFDFVGTGKIESPYKTESQWIIHEITKNIVGMICYKADPNSNPFDDLSVTVDTLSLATPTVFRLTITLPENREQITVDLTIDNSRENIWSPQVYDKLIHATLKAYNLQVPAQSSDQEQNLYTMKALLTPSFEIITRENRRISNLLTQDVFDVSAQDAAALLLGMLSWLEHAGYFTDTRKNINNMVAHLAIVEAISPKTVVNRGHQYALALLSTLIGNQKEALNSLEALTAQASQLLGKTVYFSWKDALYTSITNDWRLLSKQDNLTLFEQMACFKAISNAISTERALQWMQKHNYSKIPFFFLGRITSEDVVSVGLGHKFDKQGTQQELYAIEKSGLVQTKDERSLTDFLNQSDSACISGKDGTKPELKVIGKGLWAGYFQRHLVKRMTSEYYFYKRKWGVKKRAKKFKRMVNNNFSDLYLYPVFELSYVESQKEYLEGMEKGRLIMTRNPELYNAFAWHWLNYPSSYGVVPPGTPDLNEWFTPGFPPGTLYSPYTRMEPIRSLHQKSIQLYDQVREMNPYDYDIISLSFSHKKKEEQTATLLKEMSGQLVDYDIRIMRDLASLYSETNPSEYIKVYGKISELNPKYYFTMGDYFVEHNMTEEAVEAYEKAIESSGDSVSMSISCRWLVNYYYDNGQEERAFDLAQRAAKIYSNGGLKTMALLLEKAGRLEEAEEYYNRINERYKDLGVLYSFYDRNPSVNNAENKKNKLIGSLFPEGLQKVSVFDFSGKPLSGVIIKSNSTLLRKYGFHKGDVIMALDGFKVDNIDQYLLVRSFTNSPDMKLIIWSQRRYIEIPAHLEKRKFGVEIDTYSPR